MSATNDQLYENQIGSLDDLNLKSTVATPLEPQGDYVILEAMSLKLFTKSGLSLPGQDGATPVLLVISVGPGRRQPDGTYSEMPCQPGDYVLVNPRNIEVAWNWFDPTAEVFESRCFQMVSSHAVVAKIKPEAIEEVLDRAEKYDVGSDLTVPPAKIIRPPDLH